MKRNKQSAKILLLILTAILLAFVICAFSRSDYSSAAHARTKNITASASIEEIVVGDKVLSYDEQIGEQAYKEVKQLFRNTTKEWYHIHVNGEEIICTEGHPFYVLNADKGRDVVIFDGAQEDSNGKWVRAKDLMPTDKLLLSYGSCAIVTAIEVEELSEPQTTYNLEIEDFHTYYVGEQRVCVHNMCNKEQWVDSYDDAQSMAKNHVGAEAHVYEGKSNILVSKDGLRVARFDLNPNTAHVRKVGPHINLETYKAPFGTHGQKAITNIHLMWRS